MVLRQRLQGVHHRMTEEQYHRTLQSDRETTIARWLAKLVPFPESIAKVNVILQFDDGQHLVVDVEWDRKLPDCDKRPVAWKRWLRRIAE